MRNKLRKFAYSTFVFSSALGLITSTDPAWAQEDDAEGETDTGADAEETDAAEEAEAEKETIGSDSEAAGEAGAAEEVTSDTTEPVDDEESARAADGASIGGEASAGGTMTGGQTEAEAEAEVEAEAEESAADVSEQSWHERPSFTTYAGKGEKKIGLTLYGFLQFDAIYDTTRSFPEDIGSRVVARDDTFEGTTGRTQFTAKNTRIGMRLDVPEFGGLRTTMVIEGDFFGNQPNEPPDQSEVSFFDSPTFRLRHGYVNVENKIVDVLIGQTYDVFGWQNYFFPATVEFLGIPGQVYSKPGQIRLTKSFGETGPIGVDIAAAAIRPAQRDAEMPDLRAGARLKVNDFKGLRMPGNGEPDALPLALGVSGALRQFKVDAFTPPPTQQANSVTGWGFSVDAFIPVIPAEDKYDRGNALSLVGAFTMGSGIGDLMNATGGAEFPALPNAAQANPPPLYEPNADNGLVSFDSQGVLNTIDWQGFRAGAQYYLPPKGRLIIAANYSQAHSANMSDLFPQGGAEIELLGEVADSIRYIDTSIFWDATNALRFGLGGSYMSVRYLDGNEPHNIRGHGQAMYFF